MKYFVSLFQTVRWSQTVLLMAAAAVILFSPLPQPRTIPLERHFTVVAGGSAFSPAELSVQPGDRVTISFTALDVAHGFSIDGQPVNLVAEPGQTVKASFTAAQPGAFRIRCSLACGNMHPFMLGKFQVGPNQTLWRAAGMAMLAVAFAAWKSKKQ